MGSSWVCWGWGKREWGLRVRQGCQAVLECLGCQAGPGIRAGRGFQGFQAGLERLTVLGCLVCLQRTE